MNRDFVSPLFHIIEMGQAEVDQIVFFFVLKNAIFNRIIAQLRFMIGSMCFYFVYF